MTKKNKKGIKDKQQTLKMEIKKQINNLDSYFKYTITNFKMQICRFEFNLNLL